MKQSETLLVKKYVESAYARTSDQSADAVWADFLAELDYGTCIQAVKAHIKSGNQYPPSLADIQRGYDLLVKSNETLLADTVVALLAKDGLLDDERGEDDVKAWNKQKRIEKVKTWLASGFYPEWLRKYVERAKAPQTALNALKQIGG